MSYIINNQQKINEIIFADRNKNYGAYVIRSSYGETVFRSLAIVIGTVCTLMGIAWYLSNKANEAVLAPEQLPSTITIPVDMIHELPPPTEHRAAAPATPPPAGSPAQASGPPVVRDSVDTSTPVPDPERVASAGTNSNSTVPSLEPVIPGGGGSTVTASSTGEETVELYRVEKEPVFEGGLAALYDFISKNIKYPPIAYEEGKGGTVFVRFVVDEKGRVTSLTLRNKLGYGMDEEALRVVGIVPNFKSPAMMGGQPVKVYYQLPIKFSYRH